MFSEYYFYLTAFIYDESVRKDFNVVNDSFPTIYRIDRIKKLFVLDEKFHIPYSSRFEEGTILFVVNMMDSCDLEAGMLIKQALYGRIQSENDRKACK